MLGGTAVVRLAVDEEVEKVVAIKLCFSRNEAVNEIRIMRAIRSPVSV